MVHYTHRWNNNKSNVGYPYGGQFPCRVSVKQFLGRDLAGYYVPPLKPYVAVTKTGINLASNYTGALCVHTSMHSTWSAPWLSIKREFWISRDQHTLPQAHKATTEFVLVPQPSQPRRMDLHGDGLSRGLRAPLYTSQASETTLNSSDKNVVVTLSWKFDRPFNRGDRVAAFSTLHRRIKYKGNASPSYSCEYFALIYLLRSVNVYTIPLTFMRRRYRSLTSATRRFN